ncbi:MAG: hypothetical protein JAY97_08345 [Candidatus Thiodiazotropha sp. 'RUGA']|nr:hypothetical protein [Candidatus Thiodiazotropha sp. 'RUGA']
MNYEELSEKYQEAINMSDSNNAHKIITSIVREAACNFPRDNEEALSWFKNALKHESKKWFVAKVLTKVNPVPQALFEDLVLSALLERNPSSNRYLIEPCVKTFGVQEVLSKMEELSSLQEIVDNNGFEQVKYWVR